MKTPKEERNYWQRVYQKLFIAEYCDDVDQDGGIIFPLLCGAILIVAGILAITKGISAYCYNPSWGMAIFCWLAGGIFFFPAIWETFVNNRD
jgi:hypothetical protein